MEEVGGRALDSECEGFLVVVPLVPLVPLVWPLWPLVSKDGMLEVGEDVGEVEVVMWSRSYLLMGVRNRV